VLALPAYALLWWIKGLIPEGSEQATEVDGQRIHFIHARSKNENALPVVISHGWPGSVVEFLKIIKPLTDPEAHGGRAEDALHLVCPSLPGPRVALEPAHPI